jgi:surfactin synthase thioesterase subunit
VAGRRASRLTPNSVPPAAAVALIYVTGTTALTASHARANLWIAGPRRDTPARLRLFCLPNAGGGAAQYFSWTKLFAPEVEVCPIQLPGRESRLKERPYDRMAPLVEAMAEGVHPLLDRPFAIFGHSLGAWLAFELARELRRRYRASPSRLIVSARRAPHLTSPLPPMYELPDALFIRELARRYNGIPDVIRDDPEMLELYLPILRADVAVLETHVWVDEPPLDLPITVFGGEHDTSVQRDVLEAWRIHTTQQFTITMFPGDHFFHQSARAAVVQTIGSALRESLVQQPS